LSKKHCEIHDIEFLCSKCPRCTKGDSAPKSISQQVVDTISAKKLKKQQEKEERWRTHGTLGELTEKYINEGESEDDAYNTAKQELGL